MPSRSAPVLPFLLLVCACAGAAPEVRKEADPTMEARYQELLARDAKRRDYSQVLLTMDQAMDSYVRALNNQGMRQADRSAERLLNMLRELSLEHFEQLCATAADAAVPANQGIALAALGFSGKREAMPVVLQGAQLTDSFLVNRAVLGLAMLQDPRTPPGVLAAQIENAALGEEGRIQATWALYRIQETAERNEEIVAIWLRLLDRPMHDLHPGIVASAVRGMGLTREPTHAALVARYVTHPTPQVRIVTAVALGRMNAQDQYEALLAMLGPAETNQTARLAAYKALVALAGGVDRGYDVAEWRKVFQRG